MKLYYSWNRKRHANVCTVCVYIWIFLYLYHRAFATVCNFLFAPVQTTQMTANANVCICKFCKRYLISSMCVSTNVQFSTCLLLSLSLINSSRRTWAFWGHLHLRLQKMHTLAWRLRFQLYCFFPYSFIIQSLVGSHIKSNSYSQNLLCCTKILRNRATKTTLSNK